MARRYEVRVEKDDTSGNAKDVVFRMKPMDEESGYYVLRSNLKHAEAKALFDIFNMLLDVEDAFRSMKSELGLRPVHHQIEYRSRRPSVYHGACLSCPAINPFKAENPTA